MEKLKALWEDKRLTWILMAAGSALILLYYAKKIPYIYTVWELADEYGYLANAAYMSGTDWSFMVDLYYGYGYSILLVPLFWMFDSGLQIIRGAVFINVICIVLTVWASFALMRKLFPKVNDKLVAMAALVMGFYPYFTGSGLKVLPECLVTLMIWVCGLVFYYALSTGKRMWYLLLAAAVNYTFFVHTRTFVFLGVFFLMGAVMVFQKKIEKKNLLYFAGLAVLLFVLGTLWKNHIVDAVYSNPVLAEKSEVVGNTVSVSDIFTKITALITDFSAYDADSLCAKLFYLFVATAGVFFVGIYGAVKANVLQIKEEKQIDAANGIKLMYVLAALLMILALVVNPMGEGEGTANYFYARYYEYLAGPVVMIGLCECMERRIKVSVWLLLLGLFYMICWYSVDLTGYLDYQEVYMDLNRQPALSYILGWNIYLTDVVKTGLVLTLETLVLIFIVNQFKWTRWLIPVMLLSVFMDNDKLNVNYVIGINAKNKEQSEIAECIDNYEGEGEIYFINGDNYMVTVYTGIQSLMGDDKLNVIEAEDLAVVESGDLLITLCNNPHMEEINKRGSKIFATGIYEIYAVD